MLNLSFLLITLKKSKTDSDGSRLRLFWKFSCCDEQSSDILSGELSLHYNKDLIDINWSQNYSGKVNFQNFQRITGLSLLLVTLNFFSETYWLHTRIQTAKQNCINFQGWLNFEVSQCPGLWFKSIVWPNIFCTALDILER